MPACSHVDRPGKPMGMKQTLDVINRMEADGIIGRTRSPARWQPTTVWNRP